MIWVVIVAEAGVLIGILNIVAIYFCCKGTLTVYPLVSPKCFLQPLSCLVPSKLLEHIPSTTHYFHYCCDRANNVVCLAKNQHKTEGGGEQQNNRSIMVHGLGRGDFFLQ